MASRVASSQSTARGVPALGEPGPAGVAVVHEHGQPSGVGVHAAVDTPPMSQRSQVANSGSSPIDACSAACSGAGHVRRGQPGRAPAPASSTVHQTARVRRCRGGRSSGSSPEHLAGDQPRRRNDDDLVGHLHGAERQPRVAPRPARVGLEHADLGDVRGRSSSSPGSARRRPGHGLLEVEVRHDVGARPGARTPRRRARCCPPRRRPRCRAPGRCPPRRCARPGRRPRGGRPGRWPGRGGSSTSPWPAGAAARAASMLQHAPARRPEAAPGRRRSTAAPRRRRTGAGASTYGLSGSSTVASTGLPNSASGWCTR